MGIKLNQSVKSLEKNQESGQIFFKAPFFLI